MNQRVKVFADYVESQGARRVWSRHASRGEGQTPAIFHGYVFATKMFIIMEMDSGYDVYVPVVDANNVQATADALKAYCGFASRMNVGPVTKSLPFKLVWGTNDIEEGRQDFASMPDVLTYLRNNMEFSAEELAAIEKSYRWSESTVDVTAWVHISGPGNPDPLPEEESDGPAKHQ